MTDSTSSNKRIAKNTLFLYLRMAIVLVVSLFTTRVVLNSLGIVDYGIYNVVCGFVVMFSFLNSTLSSSINRFYNFEIGNSNERGINDVYNNAVRIQFLLALFIIFFVEILGLWYLNYKMVIPEDRISAANWIFHFAVFSLFFTILQIPYVAAVLAFERMNFYAIISIVDVILKLLIALLVKYVPFDKLLFYGLLIMLVSFFNFLSYFIYSRIKICGLKLSKSINLTLLRSMVSFSAWSFLNPLAYTARSHGCNIVLNFFFGPIVNAAYSITNQVASAIDSFSMSISVAARPQLIQSYSNNNYNRTKNLFYSSSKIMFVLIAMISFPLVFNINFILKIWLGENVPEYTGFFCAWILIVKLVDSLNPAVTTLIMATGRIKKYMMFTSFIILSIVPLSILFFKLYEKPQLLFIIMFICTIINQVGSIILLNKSFNYISINYYFITIILPCLFLASLLFVSNYLIQILLSDSSPLVIFIISFLLSFFITCFSTLFILNNLEKNMIKSLIHNFLK